MSTASITSRDNELILAEGLTKAFGLRIVLRGISFSVARGATVALLEVNGSGKTTLLRVLSGLSRPSGGTLTIGGWSLPREVAAVRSQIGFVGHQTLLYDDLTAEENLRFYARLYNQPLDCVPVALERVGLARRSHDLVGTFSRGMQQRLSIARAMLHDPAIMLLDEPFTGLDVNGAVFLNDLLREWKAAARTILITSHDLEHAAAISDQVLVIHQGKIAVDAPTTTIDNLPGLFAQVTG